MDLSAAGRATEQLICLLGQVVPSDAPRLVRLPEDLPIVYVGDIHGDLDAVEGVCSQYPSDSHTLVFLGDILDRGPDSGGALLRIVQEKSKAPSRVHLLMGNHEARSVSSFTPADFWESLRRDELERLSHHLENLPFAAWHSAGILATHGGLPDAASLDAINKIALGSESWRDMTWGDWVPHDSQSILAVKRPSLGPTAFKERSSRLGVAIHVRSHQPSFPLFAFADRCLTLITSSVYGDGVRRVARLVPGQSVATARDLEILEI